jgi:hypothetical protein
MDEDDLLEDHSSEQLDKRSCPKCGSSDVRRSSRDGLWSSILAIMGRWPYRCRSCRSRFYRHGSPPQEH